MKPFDILTSPVSGSCLVEASAGTGKTYALEGLVVRLVVLHNTPISEILVVTFTNNAVDELKSRIREKLTATKAHLLGRNSQDPFINALSKEIEDTLSAVRQINQALLDYDHAAVFTIHGFCQRVLTEQAFETHARFNVEIKGDMDTHIRMIANDYWRTHFYGAPVEIAAHALYRLSGPDYFVALYSRFYHPDALVIPSLKPEKPPEVAPYRSAFFEAAKEWQQSRADILKALANPALDGRKYGSVKSRDAESGASARTKKCLKIAQLLDRQFLQPEILFPLFDEFSLVCRRFVHAHTRARQTPPEHSFFSICDRLFEKSQTLAEQIDRYLVGLGHRFFNHAAEQMAAKKQQESFLGFDDLLIKVREALKGPSSAELKKSLRQKYKAALVDEFQDTDAVQYDIFRTLFGNSTHALYMIGDPKQAIYGFRGADVFSYMTAAAQTTTAYTLDRNWRSVPDLISAVNTMFSNRKHPFLFDEIPFFPVRPGNTAPQKDPVAPAMTIWHLFNETGQEDRKQMTVQQAVDSVLEAVAVEISSLLSPENGFAPKDIAVLVRTNRQAVLMKQALAEAGIAAVLYDAGNIFKTGEAAEFQRILEGLADIRSETHAKAALATEMMGTKGEAFDAQTSDPDWESRLMRLRQYADTWKQQGFMPMFRQLLTGEKIKQRLVRYPDGERRVTNLLHLGELLHKADMENRPGIHGLVKWLGQQREKPETVSDDHLLRLEADNQAVRIVTIHKSKGLEYPVVFCPFGWEGIRIADKPAIAFHDPHKNNARVVDLGSEDFSQHKKLSEKEALAESIRLYYVALTRARKKCYLVWGRIRNAETSAPAYLFHYSQKGDSADDPDILKTLSAAIAQKTDEELLTDLQHLVNRSGQAIALVPIPAGAACSAPPDVKKESSLSRREFSGHVEKTWKITSYSGLMAAHFHTVEQKRPDTARDRDEASIVFQAKQEIISSPAGKEQLYADIGFFPRGTHAGLFFHDLFEHLDFMEQDTECINRLIVEKLAAYGIEPEWQKAVFRLVTNVLDVSLIREQPDMKLSVVSSHQRINEMAFYFPMHKISPDELLKKYIYNDKERSPFSDGEDSGSRGHRVEGFMRGFIDLIFQFRGRYYIVDWKSNYLGPSAKDYTGESLEHAMAHHQYHAQYLIYTVALDQYLAYRVPDYAYDRHFGGVFYLFIRGIDVKNPIPGCGIYHDRPDTARIQQLSDYLIR